MLQLLDVESTVFVFLYLIKVNCVFFWLVTVVGGLSDRWAVLIEVEIIAGVIRINVTIHQINNKIVITHNPAQAP